jgi:Uma2 family endonuclease
MSFQEYMAWEAEQPEKWELVDGRPVLRSERWWRDPVTRIAGATFGHNRIVANLLTQLNTRLREGRCVALPSDLKVRSPMGNARYPDVAVECGSPAASSLLASEPRVLFEVRSPSNTLNNQLKLVADYQAIASVQQVVFLEQVRPSALLWTRNPDGWRAEDVDGLDGRLLLPSLTVELPMAEVYEGLSFDPDA